jgi:hypothetical protein
MNNILIVFCLVACISIVNGCSPRTFNIKYSVYKPDNLALPVTLPNGHDYYCEWPSYTACYSSSTTVETHIKATPSSTSQDYYHIRFDALSDGDHTIQACRATGTASAITTITCYHSVNNSAITGLVDVTVATITPTLCGFRSITLGDAVMQEAGAKIKERFDDATAY